MEPRSLIISCVPSKNIISTKTSNYTHTNTHTRAHNPFTPFITPVSDISFSSSQTVFFSLDCYCPLVLKLHSIFSSSAFDSFSSLPTTPMTLFSFTHTPSFQHVFTAHCPIIHPHSPKSYPILSFSSLVATFTISFSTSTFPPSPPPPSSSSSSSSKQKLK